MGLQDIVRGGIATANAFTRSLQVQAQHSPWIGSDATGEALFGPPVVRNVLLEYKQSQRNTLTGTTVVSRAKLTLLEPVSPNGASGRREPVDPRDRFLLPDGTDGPVVDVAGLMDPSSSAPYLFQVWIG